METKRACVIERRVMGVVVYGMGWLERIVEGDTVSVTHLSDWQAATKPASF